MKKKTSTILMGIFVIIAVVICSTRSDNGLALSDAELNVFSQNNILFYDPDACLSRTSSGICGTNKNYAGEQVFSDAQMEVLKANQPFYEAAANQYGIPWELIAVIHNREHGMARSNPDNGQGPYQFYSEAERAKCDANFSAGSNSDAEFQKHTNCAARRIKEDYGAGLDLTKDEDIMKMFFRYNGMAEAYYRQGRNIGLSEEEVENGGGSPYVMNRFDAKREPSSTWGQIKSDGGSMEYPANPDFGAFVQYKAISCGSSSGGSSSSSSGTSTSSSSGGINGVNDTAVMFADQTIEQSRSAPIQAYADAVIETGVNKLGDHESMRGSSCDAFVTTVMRKTGADSEFHCCGVGYQYDYLTSGAGKDKFDIVSGSPDNQNDLQPGDVIINGEKGHIMIYVEKDGEGYIAHASHSWTGNDGTFHPSRWAGLSPFNSYNIGGGTIFRPKNLGAASGYSSSGYCDGTAGGGQVGDSGLTYEQAKILMMNYGADINNDSTNNISGLRYVTDCPGGALSNCTAFSTFFANRFTGSPTSGMGDGIQKVDYVENSQKGTSPQVWAIFSGSTDTSMGHTGVILGHHDGEWIVGHAGCRHPGAGKGDGTYEGGGAGWVVKHSDIESATWASNLRFAYPSNVNTQAITQYINQ